VKIWEISVDLGREGIECVRSVRRVRGGAPSSSSSNGVLGGNVDVDDDDDDDVEGDVGVGGGGGDFFFTPVADVSGLSVFEIGGDGAEGEVDDGVNDDGGRQDGDGGEKQKHDEGGGGGIWKTEGRVLSGHRKRDKRRQEAICICGVGIDIWRIDAW
jgi:hypothetical protein